MGLFKRRPKAAESTDMATEDAPQIDYDALGAAFAKAMAPSIGAAIAEANKPLAEQLGKLTSPAAKEEPAKGRPGDAADAADRPLTRAELLKTLKEERDANRASESKRVARESFALDKMKDLPEAYRRDLPDTEDQATLASAEQTIRQRYRDDMKAAGFAVKDVNGNAPGGGSPATAPPDLSKLNPIQLITAGLSDGKSAFSPQNVAAKENGAVAQVIKGS
jgi:hypothetical protein